MTCLLPSAVCSFRGLLHPAAEAAGRAGSPVNLLGSGSARCAGMCAVRPGFCLLSGRLRQPCGLGRLHLAPPYHHHHQHYHQHHADHTNGFSVTATTRPTRATLAGPPPRRCHWPTGLLVPLAGDVDADTGWSCHAGAAVCLAVCC